MLSYEIKDRRVALTEVEQLTVSTVRLPQVYAEGLDNSELYETMIYDNRNDEFLDYQTRAATLNDAFIMHANAIIYLVKGN